MDDEDIQKILENHEKRITALEQGEQKATSKKKKQSSLKEFILEKGPSNSVQTTLVIGYYLEIFENLESFSVKDIEEGYRRAKVPLSTNANRDMDGNVSNGHMMEAKDKKGGRKAWVVTATGEKFVERGLKND